MPNEKKANVISNTLSTTQVMKKMSAASGAVGFCELANYPYGTMTKKILTSSGKINSFGKFKELLTHSQLPGASATTVKQALTCTPTANSSSLKVLLPHLYRGFSPNVGLKTLSRGSRYISQEYFAEKLGFAMDQVGIDSKKQTAKVITAGAAGVASGAIEAPLFHAIDTGITLQRLGDPRTFWQIVKDRKLTLYKGVGPAMCVNSLGAGGFFLNYKLALCVFGNPAHPSVKQTFLASTVASMATTLLTSPFEVVKSRIQADLLDISPGIVPAVKQLVKTEGLGFLYRGLTLRALQAVPKIGAPFLLFQLAPQITDAVKGVAKNISANFFPDVGSL